MVFFLISSIVLGLLNQLLIFSWLYLIKLLGLLTDLGLLELWHLIYPRLLTGFGMQVFFTNLKACVCYFSLFLKDKFISSLFRTKYIKSTLTYSCFFFPLLHKHLISPEPPCTTHLLETSCLEKITVFVIETMLVTLPLVQMNKAQREGNRTNHVQTKINMMKGLQTSVIHIIPGSKCH